MKSPSSRATEPGLPNGYDMFSRLAGDGIALQKFGFHTTKAQDFRFANRFKVAAAFDRIQLRGYAEPTNRAYGALFRILLTCSAVEQYQKITALGWPQTEELLSFAQRQECLAAVRKADREGKFFAAVQERTARRGLATTVQECISGHRNEVTPLIRAVRHAFAHGDLAPGANSAAPGVAQKLAKTACPLLLNAIEADFERRIEVVVAAPAAG